MPQQNGVAEHFNCTLEEGIIAMLHDAHLPLTFWGEAAMTFVEVHNSVGCIYAHYKVNPNIFQFYFDFMDSFHHPPMHPLFHNIYEFYLIFYYFISSFIIYNNHLYLRRYFQF